mmetsp:Transcript_19576/g.58350  ORF Transcript_19576/g.58350 Transcript_19576/m.58350 type:complete len:387 (+) Transcript_19576:145-1305(+)
MDGFQAVDIPTESPWQLVEAAVPPAELAAVRKAVGEHLIDDVETAYREVIALFEIWREYRQQVDMDERVETTRDFLPEPPAVRENLRSEIQFFVDAIERRGRPDATMAAAHLKVVQYALDDTHRPNSSPAGQMRPGSARPRTASTNGRVAPLRPPTAKSVDSGSRVINRVIDESDGGLSAFTIEVHAARLTLALVHERDSLLADADFLQECLDGEHEHHIQLLSQGTTAAVPSLQELRRVRSELETEYFEKPRGAAAAVATPPREGRRHTPATLAPISPSGLPNLRARASPPRGTTTRATPPKASPRRGSAGSVRRASRVRAVPGAAQVAQKLAPERGTCERKPAAGQSNQGLLMPRPPRERASGGGSGRGTKLRRHGHPILTEGV